MKTKEDDCITKFLCSLILKNLKQKKEVRSHFLFLLF